MNDHHPQLKNALAELFDAMEQCRTQGLDTSDDVREALRCGAGIYMSANEVYQKHTLMSDKVLDSALEASEDITAHLKSFMQKHAFEPVGTCIAWNLELNIMDSGEAYGRHYL